MKNTISIIIVLFAISFSAYAQNNQSLQDRQKESKIQPVLSLEDIVFAYNTLNTVEINGGEVDAFVEVRALLADKVKVAKDAGKTATDQITVEMNLLMAQNFFNLIARAKITGAQADQYKRVQDAITNAAKKLKEEGK